MKTSITIVDIFPDLLGTYGDGGNAQILQKRLQWRSFDAKVLSVSSRDKIPSGCDIYCLGGGEDAPQVKANELLKDTGVLESEKQRGAVIFGVCAGFQILGKTFVANDEVQEGLGLLDVDTFRSNKERAVGEILLRIDDISSSFEAAIDKDLSNRLTFLTGYENHAGITSIGLGARHLGEVILGIGNGVAFHGKLVDGAISKKVIGTYLHGPVLARNPEFADLILELAVGPLDSLGSRDIEMRSYRDERIQTQLSAKRKM